ncbi:FAD-dependent oxidoreductase [Mammaliicoccus lentus]|uniref:FAD-dependent oxidoreductase n=1 Tax=Mammaliicoccus lentus TaxID=42858 RepID=UPI0024A9CA48|nr:NAD(P)/FAD-dependent oxidoreductase [Mammaliicoccus lentus]WHI55062.1 NAD(P)/FAD-dependent oxidoreductase [Mammaliicoccus lentus]WHI57584.1 NAD(P)/FAD-dependent oxidoreductase [Mammaliicoccus lentus]WHI65432.1 NAD(P)/FAD-dependent oxidoreductase [Mammaliicoccus lentus]WHI86323.1 NAD(P)/FAD-dependent oxidoreductase [Mammaliicoccus lentus]
MKKQDLKHIAIVGGGPGGLMLGLLLQRQGFSFTIYERGYQNMHSDGGGSLDIHDDSGQLPLKEAGIFENFRKHARYEGEDTRIVNKDGEILYDEDAEGEGNRPEIDRGKLCDIIMEQIHPENIKYGFKFEKLIQRDNGEVELVFENGTTVMTDLVIGADGAFSQIRSHLTNAKPEYTGISMIDMNSDENEHPDLLKFNKNGKLIGLGGDQAILGQRNGDGRIMAYISFKTKYEKLDEYRNLSLDTLKERLLAEYSDWDSELKNYIAYSYDDIKFRRIYKLPIGLTWATQPNITIIGDAAHLMSPSAGEGVNMALYDAYLLAETFKNFNNLTEVLKVYEQQMFEITKIHAKESQDNLEIFFSENGAEKMTQFFLDVEK